jgi:hypothetical protein
MNKLIVGKIYKKDLIACQRCASSASCMRIQFCNADVCMTYQERLFLIFGWYSAVLSEDPATKVGEEFADVEAS